MKTYRWFFGRLLLPLALRALNIGVLVPGAGNESTLQNIV